MPNSALEGMGTTLTVMLSSGTRLGLAHVGDSRAYLLRDGEFSQITHDQTLVQRMVDEGRITVEQAETHPQRSLLTQALDGRAGSSPTSRSAKPGAAIATCCAATGSPASLARADRARPSPIPDADRPPTGSSTSRSPAGAPDNVTVVIADVVDDSAGLPVIPLVGGAAAESDAVPSAAAALVLPGGASLTQEERLAKREASRRSRPPADPPDLSDRPGDHRRLPASVRCRRDPTDRNAPGQRRPDGRPAVDAAAGIGGPFPLPSPASSSSSPPVC